ncbi:MAG TPA: hypothetical protein VJN95_18000 [Gemmatimonadales bacterium]|nr:hypothetical protein [Gemmatimonadales bacterium]
MVDLDPTLLAAIVALPVSLISLAIVRASRAARRNREERCGQCAGPLYAPGALAGPSLLQGHLICEPCAAKERRGASRSLVLAGTITAGAVVALAGVALWAPAELGSHPWIPVIATLVTYPAIFGGAVAWMKRANRLAALRLGLAPDSSLGAASQSAPSLTAGGAMVRGRGPNT